jgi:NTE family protein
MSHPCQMELPGQVVLVLQGGGALGAYQLGVYQAMHESGIDPDWVIGTSIGAVNAAIIVGNPPEDRYEKLTAFWDQVTRQPRLSVPSVWPSWAKTVAELMVVGGGIPGFFVPNPSAWLGPLAPLGIDRASYYLTSPLHDTLNDLVDFDRLNAGFPRLTVGAVNARTGAMCYFDSQNKRLSADHIVGSGALPPAFPAVRINDEPYWDGGIYSNTPLEVVFDDHPRKHSVIFSAQMWTPTGPEPQSIWEVSERQKDIQYASRTESHIARQQQIHRLRHVIRGLVERLPEADRAAPEVKEFARWGCHTKMQLIQLSAPRLDGDDQLKDIDFTAAKIAARKRAGYEATMQAIAARPWDMPIDALEALRVYSPN